MSALTKDELRIAYQEIHARMLGVAARPPTADRLVVLDALRDKIRLLIAEASAQYERGAKILDWRIPSALAPTMNAYAFLKNWQRSRIRRELDDRLRKIVEVTPNAKVHGSATKRWVRVTRFTPNADAVDDLAVDALGGKMPIDSLVRLGVLVDDKPSLCHREAMVRKTARGNTHVLVSVFEVADEEVADPGPVDGPVEQMPKPKGKLTKAIKEG